MDKNADYLLAVKGNQGQLEKAIGDLEHEWPNLKSVGIMVNMRQLDERTTERDMSVRFYNNSKKLSAKERHDATSSHWGVESMIAQRLFQGSGRSV